MPGVVEIVRLTVEFGCFGPQKLGYTPRIPPPRLPRCWQRHGVERIVFLLFPLNFHIIELKPTE
jgi:hypothetical protein